MCVALSSSFNLKQNIEELPPGDARLRTDHQSVGGWVREMIWLVVVDAGPDDPAEPAAGAAGAARRWRSW